MLMTFESQEEMDSAIADQKATPMTNEAVLALLEGGVVDSDE